ncbi:iron complex transport system substrate-binding protein [Rhodothalassium salexigens DSM 2132]|uniref:Iron complex transport system substrate-binding protein n=2 Tax=Rhodothalassium salexigens TaxID=1086 RepID=A0A4R2PPL5_RHOSA|nr:iron complex transport system substrate-binding protein [Rhodothalassium salexigens DSM 2132]
MRFLRFVTLRRPSPGPKPPCAHCRDPKTDQAGSPPPDRKKRPGRPKGHGFVAQTLGQPVARMLAVALAVTVAPANPAGGPAAWAADAGPERIVAVGGALTEIVYALGAQDRLVAVDSTSLYPAAARDLPDVGYMRNLAAEPILALDPDLVLLIEDAGPPPVIRQLHAAGLTIVTVPDDTSADGVRTKIARVAEALGRQAAGATLLDQFDNAYAEVATRIAAIDHSPRVLFVISLAGGPPMAAGAGTSAATMIDLAGGRNALDGMDGFKPLSPEAAAAAAPDIILVPQRTLDAAGSKAAILARPEFADSPAARAGRLEAMDMLLLLGFGPRLPEAVDTLATKLHPDRTVQR